MSGRGASLAPRIVGHLNRPHASWRQPLKYLAYGVQMIRHSLVRRIGKQRVD
jgi:hypothetical protein